LHELGRWRVSDLPRSRSRRSTGPGSHSARDRGVECRDARCEFVSYARAMRAVAVILLAASTASAEPTVKPADVAATLDKALAVAIDASTPRAVSTTVALIDKASGVDIASVRTAIGKLAVTFVEERMHETTAVI